MNLFKILANGYGTVNENNVSAFFGYLLDPNENHSLDKEFIKRFVDLILPDIDFDVNFYDSQVFLEQTFDKERVDIVLVFYKTNKGSNSQSQLKSFIDNEKEVEKVILIENKIKKGALNSDQVKRQRESAQKQLKLGEENIYSVYLTPNSLNFKNEYLSIKNEYTTHCLWHETDDDTKSISDILKNILTDEANGTIEPISEYTKQTIKAFIQFVASDFKSENKIKQEKKEGIFQRDLHNSIESFNAKYSTILDETSFEILRSFVNYLNKKNYEEVTYRFSKTHPIAVFFKGKKILGINRYGKKINYDIVYRNYPSLQSLHLKFEKEYENKIVIDYDNNPEKGFSRVKPTTENADEIIDIFEEVMKVLRTK